MRLTFYVLLLATLQSLAIDSYAQATKLNLTLSNTSVKQVLSEIEDISEFYFLYNSKIVDVERKVSVKFKNKKINEALDLLFKDTPVSYNIVDRQIVLSCESSPNTRSVYVQQESITGIVTDEGGLPLPGVTVLIKGTTKGTVTNMDGIYTISNIPDGATLQFSFVGMLTQEIEVAGQTTINVTMVADAIGIEEVVAIGYGTQKKTSVVAAVSSLKGDEIAKVPSSNITNSIAGRLSGVIIRQVSGQPASDVSNIYIRGVSTTGSSAPLIIVDGIPRGFNELDPNSIANVSVLKDASAVAPYGVAGANGVILVTTKRGKTGEPTIKYNGYYGVQNPTFLPDFVNFEQFAKLKNQIAINANQPIQWTDELIQKHLSGSDPDRYPNTDFVGTIIEKNAPITNHNIEISGGTEKINYYASLGYQHQTGMWKTDNKNRYSMIINFDAKVTNTTKVSLNVNGRVQKHKEPSVGDMVNQGPEWIMQLLSYAHPDIPAFLNDGKYYGTYVTAGVYGGGEKKTDLTQIYTKIAIDQEIPFIPGLNIKGALAFDPTSIFIKSWQTPKHIHSLDITTNPYSYIDGIWGEKSPLLNETYKKYTQLTWQGSLNYKQTFGKNNLTALALFEGKENSYNYMSAGRKNYSIDINELNMGSSSAADRSNSGSSSLARQLGFVGRLSYNYDNKYLVELSGRYDGHYYFAPEKRWGFFPSAALGWRISEESFIKDNISWIDNLKIRASYGEVGALAGSAFQYMSMYGAYGPAYAFSGSAVNAVNESSEANPNITWERAKKSNIGLETTMWKGLFYMEADYFYEKRSNMLLAPSVDVPGEYGIGLSQVNAGIMENRGIDLTLGSSYKFSKDLRVSVNGTFTYARNKLLEVFETSSTYDNPNRRLTGKPLGVMFGYNALGYFEAEDFDSNGNLLPDIATQPWGAVQPGDLRYEDVNNNGEIDNDDIVQIGKSKIPEIIYGISPTIQYKNFNLNLLFQGAGNANFQIYGAGAWAFWGSRAAYSSHLDNWTTENTDAKYPRLVAGQTENNKQTSTWWVENTSYLRLKNATLSYNIPNLDKPEISNSKKYKNQT